MTYSEPNSSEPGPISTSEERLRQEVEELRRQLQEHQRLLEHQQHTGHGTLPPKPSRGFLWLLSLGVTAVLIVAFFAGYFPRMKREAIITAEAREQEQSMPRVNVATVVSASGQSQLVLPGNIQAVTEAPILARITGYVKSRKVDIGDRVQAGQLLAEIEEPEIDQQVRQAQATLQQAQAALEQANANYEQGKSNVELARITAERWAALQKQGIVSRQENDQYQTQYHSQTANVAALEKAVAAAKSNIAAAQANLARLQDEQSYKQVRAPFAGVITVRNVDVGALITAGNTLLFRIAQTGVLRTYVNVPQSDAESVHVGQAAQLTVSNLPGKHFAGRVARTANALDPTTRTLLVEVEAPNTTGLLLPGMYADVDLRAPRQDAPMVIPGDALVVRANGPQVAVVGPDHVVHFQKIQIARDYGDHLDVDSGVHAGDEVILHVNDSVREGTKVEPVETSEKSAAD
jgi:RND family efflux transporter MFP subunit